MREFLILLLLAPFLLVTFVAFVPFAVAEEMVRRFPLAAVFVMLGLAALIWR
jgi:hypothetical protein